MVHLHQTRSGGRAMFGPGHGAELNGVPGRAGEGEDGRRESRETGRPFSGLRSSGARSPGDQRRPGRSHVKKNKNKKRASGHRGKAYPRSPSSRLERGNRPLALEPDGSRADADKARARDVGPSLKLVCRRLSNKFSAPGHVEGNPPGCRPRSGPSCGIWIGGRGGKAGAFSRAARG